MNTVIQVTPTATITVGVERDPDKLLRLLRASEASNTRLIERLQKARAQRDVYRNKLKQCKKTFDSVLQSLSGWPEGAL